MKYILALFIFLSPAVVLAQTSDTNTDLLVKQKWEELKSAWTFGLPDAGNGSVDIRTFNKYKSLFDSSAIITSDIDAVYKPYSKSSINAYQLIADSASFDSYAHDIVLHFNNYKVELDTPSLKITTAKNETIYTITRSVTGAKKGEFVFESENPFLDSVTIRSRNIDGLDTDIVTKKVTDWFNKRSVYEYQFQLKDTIEIHFNTSRPEGVTVNKINRTGLSSNPVCLNDLDGDGMVITEDNCPAQWGDITAQGCPDLDFDGTIDSLDACGNVYYIGNNGCPPDYFKNKFSISFFAGLQLNSCDLNLVTIQDLGYNQVDPNQSDQGSLTNPGLNISPVYGGDISWYFNTKKRNTGLSVGVNYTAFSATYHFNGSAVYTYRASDGTDEYRRRITIANGSEEAIKYHILDFPILFKYRNRFGKPKDQGLNLNKPAEELKWSWEVSVGPSVIFFNNTSNYNINLSFEGLYQIDTTNFSQFNYYENYDNGSTYNLELTGAGLNSQSTLPGADTVFNFLNANGYDFAYNKNYTGKDKKANRVSVAINANFSVNYKANDFLSLKIGVSVVAAPLPNMSKGFEPIQNTTDIYKSFYQSKSNSFYMSGGLNAGIIIDWR